MQDLNVMRVFVRVAEMRSFSEAGRLVGLTPSAVSKAVRRLEREFGVRLFNRTTRSVGLTDEGQEFFERCRQMLADVEEAESQLTQSTLRPRGRLRVHMPMGFGRIVVLPALANVVGQYPDLRIDVEFGERPVDPAEEGMDAVIRFGALPDSALVARKLCDVRFMACASPAYLRKRGTPRIPDELDSHTCLGYATAWAGHYRPWPFFHDGREISKSISGQLNANSAEALRDTAIAGAGIAMIGDFVIHDAVRAGKLRVILRDYIGKPMPVSVLYPPVKERAPRVRWFLETLQAAIATPAPWNDVGRA
jgi:LysR family transcriptional regulator for bpeEF and oprC